MTGGSFGYTGAIDAFPAEWKASGRFRIDYPTHVPEIPQYFQKLSRKEQSQIIQSRSNSIKLLTHAYYQYLAREFLRGDTLNEGKGLQFSRNNSGVEYEYLPDIIHSVGGRGRNKAGEIHFEIKTRHHRSSSIGSPDQAAKYGSTIYDGEFEGCNVFGINVLFFTYQQFTNGYVRKKSKSSTKIYSNPKPQSLGKLSGSSLTKYLSENTRDCIIAPFNLYLFMLRAGREQVDGNDRENYREIGEHPSLFVKDINIHKGLQTGLARVSYSPKQLDSIDAIAYEAHRKQFGLGSARRLDLMLDALKARTVQLPGPATWPAGKKPRFDDADPPKFFGVHGDNRYPVKPFQITEYYMAPEDNARWLERLRDNYGDIMKQSGLRDFSSGDPF